MELAPPVNPWDNDDGFDGSGNGGNGNNNDDDDDNDDSNDDSPDDHNNHNSGMSQGDLDFFNSMFDNDSSSSTSILDKRFPCSSNTTTTQLPLLSRTYTS